MSSKASKLRIKRMQRAGRPRKENVERYPSGQIKHEERERDVKQVAMAARMNIHKLDTNSVFAGYTLGRLFLDGRISEVEREAGDEYAAQMARYYGLVGIQFPSARAQDMFSINGFGGETSAERASMARDAAKKMMDLEGTLLRLQDGPRVKTTCYNTCVLDLEIMRTMPEAQLLWLKRGLRQVHWFLGLAQIGKSR